MKTYFLKYFSPTFKSLKKWALFLSLTSSLLLSASLPTRALAEEVRPAVSSVSIDTLDGATFYKMVDEESTRVLERLKPAMSAEESQGLLKVKEKTIKILKGLNMFEHAKDMLRKHGVGLAATNIIGEIVTSLLLPPWLYSMGYNWLATALLGTPSPLYIVPSYLAGASFVERVKLAKKMELGPLGVLELKKLDSFRRELMGFSIKHKIMDVMVKSLDEDREVSIVRETLFHRSKNFKGSVVSLKELEKMVKEKVGGRNFKLIQEFAHGHDAVYANLLVQEVDRDPKLKEQFLTLAKERWSSSLLLDETHKKFISDLDEELKVLSMYREKSHGLKGDIHGELKKQQMKTKENQKIVDDFFKGNAREIDFLEQEMKMLEYRYLTAVKTESPLDPETSNIDGLKERMETLKKKMQESVLTKGGDQDYLHSFLDKLKSQTEGSTPSPCEGAKAFFRKIIRGS